MSDLDEFTAAFERGQEAARHAEQAKADIDQIIRAVKDQISTATQGKVEIAIVEFNNAVLGMLELSRTVSDPLQLARASGTDKSQWISARNTGLMKKEWVRLAQWVRPHTGYPCTLTFNSKEVRCHDHDGLVRALSQMLADSWIGQKLHSLLMQTGDE